MPEDSDDPPNRNGTVFLETPEHTNMADYPSYHSHTDAPTEPRGVHLLTEQLQRLVAMINSGPIVEPFIRMEPPEVSGPAARIPLTMRAGFDPAGDHADATALTTYWGTTRTLPDIDLDTHVTDQWPLGGIEIMGEMGEMGQGGGGTGRLASDMKVIDAAQALFDAMYNPMGGDDKLDVLWHRLGAALHGFDHPTVKRIDPMRPRAAELPTKSAWDHLTDEEDTDPV